MERYNDFIKCLRRYKYLKESNIIYNSHWEGLEVTFPQTVAQIIDDEKSLAYKNLMKLIEQYDFEYDWKYYGKIEIWSE